MNFSRRLTSLSLSNPSTENSWRQYLPPFLFYKDVERTLLLVLLSLFSYSLKDLYLMHYVKHQVYDQEKKRIGIVITFLE